MRGLAAAALALALASGAAARSAPGDAAGTFLRIPVGARAIGMGGAYTAVSDDPYAMHYNPAGLGWIDNDEVTFQYNNLILDLNQQYIGYVHPLRRGSFGLAWNRVDFGSFDRTLITSGTTFASAGKFDASSNAVTFAYGRPIGERVSLGLQAKWIWEDIAGFTASAGAVDAGIHYRDPNGRLRIGATVQNVGSEIKFLTRSDPLPLLARVGISYQPTDRLLFTSDVEKSIDSEWNVRVGTEYWLVESMALRAGFDPTNEESANYTVGLGFRWRDFKLDYAFTDEGVLDQTHRVALGFRWGGGREDDDGPAPVRRTLREKIPREAKNYAASRSLAPRPAAPLPVVPRPVAPRDTPRPYYALIEGMRYGPVTYETLREWNREGRIPATSWIWQEGDIDARSSRFYFPE